MIWFKNQIKTNVRNRKQKQKGKRVLPGPCLTYLAATWPSSSSQPSPPGEALSSSSCQEEKQLRARCTDEPRRLLPACVPLDCLVASTRTTPPPRPSLTLPQAHPLLWLALSRPLSTPVTTVAVHRGYRDPLVQPPYPRAPPSLSSSPRRRNSRSSRTPPPSSSSPLLSGDPRGRFAIADASPSTLAISTAPL